MFTFALHQVILHCLVSQDLVAKLSDFRLPGKWHKIKEITQMDVYSPELDASGGYIYVSINEDGLRTMVNERQTREIYTHGKKGMKKWQLPDQSQQPPDL